MVSLVKTFIKDFSPFYFASPEIIEVEICYRQTDKFYDTIYGCVWIFSFNYLLPPYSLHSQGDYAVKIPLFFNDTLNDKIKFYFSENTN